jgi:internalin A
VLNLHGNRLTELPTEIGQLTNLTKLYLWGNQLRELPAEIGQLANLVGLYLSGNQLRSLPAEIGQLVNLIHLYLFDNQLSRLPAEIGQLVNLTELHLYNNRLSGLPESLKGIRSLKYLFLHNNKLGIPLELLGADPIRQSWTVREGAVEPARILDYYFRTRGGRRPLNEAKIILVGRGEVGKTCIVNRLVDGVFEDTSKTDGIKISDWKVRAGGDEVRLNIWDFGGQEIMHATHQFFLTQRSLYLLTLNGREGGEDYDAEYWLKLIESFAGDSPVIVVLNKIDQHPFDLNYRGLQTKYPQIRGFVKTDCKTQTGIKDLHKEIVRVLGEMGSVKADFPSAWFAIKDELAGMKENYLSFEQFRAVCRANQETDTKAQEELAGFLHCLGIALNYKDDPRLRDTSVLNPRWVTQGIYRLLNAGQLADNKGVLRLADMAAILPAEEYPEEKHEFLMELMRKFRLCFAFPDGQHRYLVPELLGKEEPDLKDEFEPKRCLNFEYHYGILPEGLLPQFIVRTHPLSHDRPRWRSGVVLQWEGCRALVKADAADRRVVVRINGADHEGRRRLLAVIRCDFERIHSDISKLEVKGTVPLPEHPEVAIDYDKLLLMEQKGVKDFPEAIQDDIVTVNVTDLLNGVDLSDVRRRTGPEERGRQQEPLGLFYSYSHKDENLRDELETHLKLLQRQGAISDWHDRRILAGGEWDKKIDENLEKADIILLLISADFIASDYCYDVEMKRAMERHENKEAVVIPVILRDCDWHSAPFGKLQALPKDGKAVKLWSDRDSAWNNVAQGIRKVIEQVRGFWIGRKMN